MPNAVPQLSKRNMILKGYKAFNDADWNTISGLLSDNVVWHKMDNGGTEQGRDKVVAYLQELRASNEAELFGMALKGNAAVTVDFTYSTDEHGDHGCADRIEFDTAGLICEVWHCTTDTEHRPEEHAAS